jgi:hypothetical protein
MQMWKRYLTATADMNVQQCLRQPMKLYIFTSDLWTRGVQESNFLLVDEFCAAHRWGSGHLCLKADLHGTHQGWVITGFSTSGVVNYCNLGNVCNFGNVILAEK